MTPCTKSRKTRRARQSCWYLDASSVNRCCIARGILARGQFVAQNALSATGNALLDLAVSYQIGRASVLSRLQEAYDSGVIFGDAAPHPCRQNESLRIRLQK
jgi:hypothetical protein